MDATLSEIAKTKINPIHRTLFVDKSTSVIDQLKDLLFFFQPKPISNLSNIEIYTPLVDTTSTIQRDPLLNLKS